MNMRESHYKQLLDTKLKQSRYKQLKCILPYEEINRSDPTKPLLNFSSGDFLGLSNHPFVKKNTIQYVLKWGAGSSPSRLVTSHLERQHELEKKLASLLNKESSFFLNPVQNIHKLTLTPLGVKESVFFIDDSVSHLIRKAAQHSHAKIIYFNHNNLNHLKSQIETHALTSLAKVIVTESIFQTGGDVSPIQQLSRLATEAQALLYVDDSLSFSATGGSGLGLASPKLGVDIAVSSFGRSSGAFGNFVATSEALKEYMIQFCPELAAVTLLPPAALGAIDASMELIPDMHEERQKMETTSSMMREILSKKGLDIGHSQSHIFPLHLSSEQELFHLYHHLVEEQILVQNLKTSGIAQTPILRLLLSAAHSKEQVKTFEERLHSWTPPLQYETAFR